MVDIFHYRDCLAEQGAVDVYNVGMELVEPAYVDASKMRGGLLGNCNLRYLILSGRGLDLGLINTNAKRFGLVVFPRGLKWQVLDKYTLNGVTQLLIRPRVEGGVAPNIITAAHIDFNELRYMQPVSALDTAEWKDRLFFPLGIKENGDPYLTT